ASDFVLPLCDEGMELMVEWQWKRWDAVVRLAAVVDVPPGPRGRGYRGRRVAGRSDQPGSCVAPTSQPRATRTSSTPTPAEVLPSPLPPGPGVRAAGAAARVAST